MGTESKALALSVQQRTAYLQNIECYILEQGGVVDVPQTVSLYMVKKNARNDRRL